MRPVGAALLVMPLLSACQTTQSRGPVVLDAANDTCAVHRAAFRSTEPTFDDVAARVGMDVARAVAIGVVVGAVTRDPRRGAAAGAAAMAAGITVTLVSANFQQLEGERRREALLGQTVAVNKYGERVTGAHIELDRLGGCRRLQVRAVQEAHRQRRLPQAEAQAQLAEIRNWYDGDLLLIRSFDERLAADTRQLADSTQFINVAPLDTSPPFRTFGGIVASPGAVKQAASATAGDGPSLPAGQSVRVTGREGNWYRVALPGNRTGFVPVYAVAQEVGTTEHQGASAQPIRSAAKDDADTVGEVATGSTYRVVGRMTGWMVVDNAGRRSFVRATALRPVRVDETGAEVVQATASAVASRNAFSSGTDNLAAEARRVTLDS
ncbi:MAG: hypothetical protein EBY30_16375 [Rhodospirillales bacterium]|nr:hypothetical protein [Rhodospirillales bacterium]